VGLLDQTDSIEKAHPNFPSVLVSIGKGRLAFTFLILVVCVAAAWASDEAIGQPLENTYWKLVELNGKAVAAASRRREPHLLLNSEGKILQGSGGCNTMRGGYQLDGARLRFTQIVTTRMACPDPYMSQESEFLKALEAANSFKLSGDKLELYDDGKLLARFEARNTK